MPNIEVTAEVATEMHRLHGRIAELERQVQEAHAELGLASQTDVQARLHARVAELEAFRLARIGEPTMAEVDAENEALRSRVSELEEIARLAAASVRNQAWAGICDDDILLEQALVKANFI